VDLVFSSVLWLTVIFADPVGDGSFNYLLQRKNGATDREFMIAHSYPTDMGIKPGDQFQAKVEMRCHDAWALDPVPEVMKSAQPFGDPRKMYVCNADNITIQGKEYKSLVRSN